MAWRAFPERSLAGRYVLGERCSGRYYKSDGGNQRNSHLLLLVIISGLRDGALKALPTTNAPPQVVRMALLRPPVNGESPGIGVASQCLSNACRLESEPAPWMSISSGWRSALEHFSINCPGLIGALVNLTENL
jgi:hypothetical protein